MTWGVIDLSILHRSIGPNCSIIAPPKLRLVDLRQKCLSAMAPTKNSQTCGEDLIDIKNLSPRSVILAPHQTELAMPIDSILVSAAVVTVFVIFAGVLIRADLQS